MTSFNSFLLSRKSVLTGFFLIFSFMLLAQKPGHVWPEGEAGKDYNMVDAKGKRQGPWIRVYGNNPKALLYKGQFKDGNPEGVWEWYYPTGEIMTVMTHVKGEEITDNINYYEDGITKMSEGRFVVKTVGGKPKRCREGAWKLYSKTGSVLAEENYKDSILDGVCKYYYPSGKLVSIYPYTMGERNGPFVEYYENGKKMREGTYKAGSWDGPFVSFYENGMKEMEGKYVKGVLDGSWRHYTPKGLVEMQVLYDKGTVVKKKYENGTFEDHYDSGIPKSEYSYSDGELDGPFTEWYDQGSFIQVPTSKEDQEMGVMYREKLDGTQIKRQGDYSNGKLEGEVIYYTEKGLIEKIEVYEDGVLVKTKKS